MSLLLCCWSVARKETRTAPLVRCDQILGEDSVPFWHVYDKSSLFVRVSDFGIVNLRLSTWRICHFFVIICDFLRPSGPQLPGHGGDGRLRGDHPGRPRALHPRGQAQQPPRMRQRDRLGAALQLPHLHGWGRPPGMRGELSSFGLVWLGFYYRFM